MPKPNKITLTELINKCQVDSSCNDWAEIGIISIGLRNLIFEKTGIDLYGYILVIEGSSINHSIKRHGRKSNDRTCIDFPDFYCLPEILKRPDNIKLGENSRTTNNKRILFEKTIGHTFFCVEEIRSGSKKNGRIAFLSLRKRIKYKSP